MSHLGQIFRTQQQQLQQINKKQQDQKRQTIFSEQELRQTQGSIPQQQELQSPRKSQEENFKFKLDEGNYQLKLEKINCMLPEFPIYENQGTTWYYVNDQQLIQQDNGKYYPLYQNEQGDQGQIELNIISQWGIKITCNFDDYCYIGMLTEQEITQKQQLMTIDEVFDELLEEFKNHQRINEKDGLINLSQSYEKLEINQTLKLKIGNNSKNASIQWILLRKEDEQIVKKKILGIQKYNIQVLEKLEKIKLQNEDSSKKLSAEFKLQMKELLDQQYQQQLQQQQKLQQEQQQQQQQYINTKFSEMQQQIEKLSAEFQEKLQVSLDQQQKLYQALIKEQFQQLIEHSMKIEKSQQQIVQNMQTLRNQITQQQINNLVQQQNDQIIVKPSDLTKTSGFFWVSQQCVTKVTILYFTLKTLNSMGLVIGLDHNDNPVTQPYYCINFSIQTFFVGKDQKTFQKKYVPKVGDQLFLKVDMNQLQVVLLANQEEILGFKLDDQEENEFKICVGYFNQFENINDFIE